MQAILNQEPLILFTYDELTALTRKKWKKLKRAGVRNILVGKKLPTERTAISIPESPRPAGDNSTIVVNSNITTRARSNSADAAQIPPRERQNAKNDGVSIPHPNTAKQNNQRNGLGDARGSAGNGSGSEGDERGENAEDASARQANTLTQSEDLLKYDEDTIIVNGDERERTLKNDSQTESKPENTTGLGQEMPGTQWLTKTGSVTSAQTLPVPVHRRTRRRKKRGPWKGNPLFDQLKVSA